LNSYNKFKHFQEAEGWPGWVKTTQDRQKYLDDIFDREQIRLDADKVGKIQGKGKMLNLS